MVVDGPAGRVGISRNGIPRPPPLSVWILMTPLRLALVSVALCLVALGLGSSVAAAHSSGCHSAHSCPSDHHTYVWNDGSGQGWDCAKPGAPEYDPSQDTTTITYGGHTYYCRAAGSATPPPPTDSDGDGVADTSDACPYEYATTLDGCPAPAAPAPKRKVYMGRFLDASFAVPRP